MQNANYLNKCIDMPHTFFSPSSQRDCHAMRLHVTGFQSTLAHSRKALNNHRDNSGRQDLL